MATTAKERAAKANEAAIAEGWRNRTEKYRANKAGISDPAVWAAHNADHLPQNGDGVTWTEPSLDDVDQPVLALEGGDIGAVQELPLDRVQPAADNPRRNVDVDDDMVASIRAIGILQPLIVTVHPDQAGHWLIVAGHRRHLAAASAGLATVPALVREFTPVERVEAMLVENLQRKDLDPFDEAYGFRQLSDLGRSQREIADRVGRNQSHVSRRLKLVGIDEAFITAFAAGTITLRTVEELAVESPEVRHAARRLLEKGNVHESNLLRLAGDAVAEAAARLVGKESGLPEWTGNHWSLTSTDGPEGATHWFLTKDWSAGGRPIVRFGIIRDDTNKTSSTSTSSDTDREEREARRAAEEEATKERLLRTKERREFAAAHLDDLYDTAIKVMATDTNAWEILNDNLDGTYRLLGFNSLDAPEGDNGPDVYGALEALAESASRNKKHLARIFTAKVIDGVETLIGASWAGLSKATGIYLAALGGLGWTLNATELEHVDVAYPPTTATDADGITDHGAGDV